MNAATNAKVKHYPVWGMPLLLALLTLFGLLDALLIDNTVARVIAWLALAVPAIVSALCFGRGLRKT